MRDVTKLTGRVQNVQSVGSVILVTVSVAVGASNTVTDRQVDARTGARLQCTVSSVTTPAVNAASSNNVTLQPVQVNQDVHWGVKTK